MSNMRDDATRSGPRTVLSDIQVPTAVALFESSKDYLVSLDNLQAR